MRHGGGRREVRSVRVKVVISQLLWRVSLQRQAEQPAVGTNKPCSCDAVQKSEVSCAPLMTMAAV